MAKRKQTKAESPADDGASLPGAELEVLACLWQKGEATTREVRETMADYRPMTHGAMVTLLRRLEAKGWVKRRKASVGKAFIHMPTRRPEQTLQSLLAKVRRRIFGGNGVALISTLLDNEPPTSEELDDLEAMFQKLRKRQAKKGKPKA